MSKKTPNYSVGYCKPPKETRFRKGQSGNPAGGSKKARGKTPGPYDTTLANLWMEEGQKEFSLTVNGETEKVTLARGAIRRTYYDAVAGKPTALRLVHLNGHRSESDRREMYRERLRDAAEVQGMAQRELNARLSAGEKYPVVIPHPDDIVFDPATGEVALVGPGTPEEYELMLERIKVRDMTLDAARDAQCEDRSAYIAIAAKLNDMLPPRLRIDLPPN